MFENKIVLSPQDILEKEFKIDTRGYRLKEVDQFLDVVINDYEEFYKIINALEQEKAEQLSELMRLKQELRNAKTNIEIAKTADINNDEQLSGNVDILKRLSKLEKMVYDKEKKDE